MAGYVTGAAVVGGELVLSLSDGQIIRAGYIQGSRGEKGEPGQPGPQGLPGRDGNGMLHGPGVPRPDEGVDNDFFYDTSEAAIYGPKVGGSWGSPVYLKPRGIKATTGQEYDSRIAGGRGGRGRIMVGGGPMMATGNNTAGLDRIFDHDLPLLAANTPKLIAGDTAGDAFHVLLFAEAGSDSWYGEIICTRNQVGQTSHVVAWETPIGSDLGLSFTTAVNAGQLELFVTTPNNLDKIRGKIIYI